MANDSYVNCGATLFNCAFFPPWNRYVQSCRLIINMQKVVIYPPSIVSSDSGSTSTDFSLTSFIDVSWAFSRPNNREIRKWFQEDDIVRGNALPSGSLCATLHFLPSFPSEGTSLILCFDPVRSSLESVNLNTLIMGTASPWTLVSIGKRGVSWVIELTIQPCTVCGHQIGRG